MRHEAKHAEHSHRQHTNWSTKWAAEPHCIIHAIWFSSCKLSKPCQYLLPTTWWLTYMSIFCLLFSPTVWKVTVISHSWHEVFNRELRLDMSSSDLHMEGRCISPCMPFGTMLGWWASHNHVLTFYCMLFTTFWPILSYRIVWHHILSLPGPCYLLLFYPIISCLALGTCTWCLGINLVIWVHLWIGVSAWPGPCCGENGHTPGQHVRVMKEFGGEDWCSDILCHLCLRTFLGPE